MNYVSSFACFTGRGAYSLASGAYSVAAGACSVAKNASDRTGISSVASGLYTRAKKISDNIGFTDLACKAATTIFNYTIAPSQGAAQRLGCRQAVSQANKAIDRGLGRVHFVTILEQNVLAITPATEEADSIGVALVPSEQDPQVTTRVPIKNATPVSAMTANLLASKVFRTFIEKFIGKLSFIPAKETFKNWIFSKMMITHSRDTAKKIVSFIRTKFLIDEEGNFTDRHAIKMTTLLLSGFSYFFLAASNTKKKQDELPDDATADQKKQASEKFLNDLVKNFDSVETTQDYIAAAKARVTKNLAEVTGKFVRGKYDNAVIQTFYNFLGSIASSLVRTFAPNLLETAYEVFMPDLTSKIEFFLHDKLGLPAEEIQKLMGEIETHKEVFFWYFLDHVSNGLAHFEEVEQEDTHEALHREVNTFLKAIEPAASYIHTSVMPKVSASWKKYFNWGERAASLIGVPNTKKLVDILSERDYSVQIWKKLMEHIDRATDVTRTPEPSNENPRIVILPATDAVTREQEGELLHQIAHEVEQDMRAHQA